MQSLRTALVALLAVSGFGPSLALTVSRAATGERAMSRANPIRKVVTMLQMMMKKVEAEGDKEKELYDAFVCYCKSGAGQLQKAVNDANKKIPELESSIAELEALLAKLKEDVKHHQADRDAAKAAISVAVEIRKKEAAAAKSEGVDNQVMIAALKRAIAALEKGTAEAFLQTSAAATLKRLLDPDNQKINLMDADRQDLMAFLDAPASGNEYVPQSAEIIGILKQMMDEFIASEKEGGSSEGKAIEDFKLLLKAKLAEIAALNKLIENKMGRMGEISVKIAMDKNDFADTSQSLDGDSKFLADLDASCKKKAAEWEERCKLRNQELAALADTIKVLNDDDALDLFKKTLPSASLLQLQVTSAETRHQALAMIHALHSRRPQFDLIALALSGKKIGFGKIITMIDEMLATLKKEQGDDDSKKQYCEKELGTADDKKKALERTLADIETEIAALTDAIVTVTAEIDDLEDGIRALDKSVAEATEQRKEENAEYQELMASNGAAKELILFAKNRMQKFYNPALYKAPAKRELTEEERITLNNGGTLAPTVAPAGIAGTGIGLAQVAEQQPPPTFEGEYKKSDSGGALGLMDMLVKDLQKEMTEGSAEEENSQKDYESFMTHSKEKREEDAKSTADKTEAKAEMEGQLEAKKEAKSSTEKSLGGANEYIHALHSECDFLMKFYPVRQEARAGEVSALTSAKAVLNGADYSFLQMAHSTHERL